MKHRILCFLRRHRWMKWEDCSFLFRRCAHCKAIEFRPNGPGLWWMRFAPGEYEEMMAKHEALWGVLAERIS